jgi:hypothetical protein
MNSWTDPIVASIPLNNADEVASFLQQLTISAIGPKGIVTADETMVGWGEKLGPQDEITLLGRSKDGKSLNFRAFGKTFRVNTGF